MKDAWVSFLTVHIMNKGGVKKVTAGICKVQSFCLSHHSWREGIMAKLEEKVFVYLQSSLDHSLEKFDMMKSQTLSAIPPRNGSSSIILQVWNTSLFPWSVHVI